MSVDWVTPLYKRGRAVADVTSGSASASNTDASALLLVIQGTPTAPTTLTIPLLGGDARFVINSTAWACVVGGTVGTTQTIPANSSLFLVTDTDGVHVAAPSAGGNGTIDVGASFRQTSTLGATTLISPAPGEALSPILVEGAYTIATIAASSSPPTGASLVPLNSEGTFYATVEVSRPGYPADCGIFTCMTKVRNIAGVLTATLPSISVNLTNPGQYAATLSGTTVAYALVGGYLVLQVTRAAGVDISARPVEITREIAARQPYAYVRASLVTPTSGPLAGGTTITGPVCENMGTLTGATCGGVPCTGVTSTDSTFSITTGMKSGPGGVADIVLTGTGPGFPLALAGAFTYGAPTLTAPASPYLAPAAGGGPSVTLVGTNLGGATAVTIGATTVTPTSSTATSVTFVWPAKAASGTGYSISVTATAGASNTLTNAVYYLPSTLSFAWYAPQNYATGVWTDLVSGLATAVAGPLTAPASTSTWNTNKPALVFTGGNGLTAVLGPIAQPASVFVIGDCTSINTGASSQLFDGTTNTASRWSCYASALNQVTLYDQAGPLVATASPALTTPQLLEIYNNGASSSVTQNNGTPVVGNAGTGSLSGLAIGCGYNNSSTTSLIGHIQFIAIGSSAVSAADRAIIHSIAQAIGGVA